MPLWKLTVVAISLAWITGAAPLHAYAMKLWSYDELTTASDIVVILEPVGSEVVSDPKVRGNLDKELQVLRTRFKVVGILKGSPVKDEIVLMHYAYAPGMPQVDGPPYIRFHVGNVSYELLVKKGSHDAGGRVKVGDRPCWLAFLKKGPEGTFVPATGQSEAESSFKELHYPLFFTED